LLLYNAFETTLQHYNLGNPELSLENKTKLRLP
jgi:hypothetical protein